MIANPEIYVIGKGFVNASELTVGNQVYTLDGHKVEKSRVDSIKQDFVSQRLNRIDSGNHNALLTDDARLLYYSDLHGYKYISFDQIDSHTRDKAYLESKYLPILSWMDDTPRQFSDAELERVARSVAVNVYDYDAFGYMVENMGGQDCSVLVDMLELWISVSPGTGWFGRAQVKTRNHPVRDKYFAEELAVICIRAGYTSALGMFDERKYSLRVNYEPMPIPGSRPKNEKYRKEYFTGYVYNINAQNRPILGRSLNRMFYLPTSSVNNDIMKL